ncbi:MAG: CdvA-like protein [Candidatus Bathyarchaeia archaeon]
MISWKHSFEELNEEYEMTKKKKQALDNLLNTGRISQSTHELFSMEIAEAVTDIERRQKALLQKMNSKMVELEEQIKTLEILLTNFEVQHVIGEVDEETYQREINVLSMGLETSRLELNSIKEAADQLACGNVFTKQRDEPQVAGIEVVETLQKPKVEFGSNEVDSTKTQTALQGAEDSQTVESSTKTEEKQET